MRLVHDLFRCGSAPKEVDCCASRCKTSSLRTMLSSQKLTDKPANQSTTASILWTKTKWKYTFFHWQCSVGEYTANRVSVSSRKHHICGKCILWRVEIRTPWDRSVSLAAYPINSSHANRTTKIHRQRSDSLATFAAERSPDTALRIPNSEWRTVYGAVNRE